MRGAFCFHRAVALDYKILIDPAFRNSQVYPARIRYDTESDHTWDYRNAGH